MKALVVKPSPKTSHPARKISPLKSCKEFMNTIVNNEKDVNKENPSTETPRPVRQISPLKSRKETIDIIVNVGKYKS